MNKNCPQYLPSGRIHSPFRISTSRRVQTLSALIHCSSIVLLPCLYYFMWCYEKLWPFLIMYSVYSYIIDDTPSTGESIYRRSVWLRKQFIAKGFVNYFPIITHRTVRLPESIRKRIVSVKCLPLWTRWLPRSLRNLLQALGIIHSKKRIVEEEEAVGPRYMFACHPHGVISFGVTGSIGWSGEDEVYDTIFNGSEVVQDVFKEEEKEQIKSHNKSDTGDHVLKSSKSFISLFPNIPTHLLTLSTQFKLPFYRDYIMALGVGLVTKSGIKSLLKLHHSVGIVVGGAHESLLAKPGSNKIVLNKRKGFIKIALQSCNLAEDDLMDVKEHERAIRNGEWSEKMSDLAVVPVYVYGENNIHNVYNTVEGHKERASDPHYSRVMKILLSLQLSLKKYTGFTLPIVNSRSVFNYDFGLLPYKRRVDVVVGEPIYIYRKFGCVVGDDVGDAEIDYYHNLYKEKLVELWKKNKGLSNEWDEDLEIVE